MTSDRIQQHFIDSASLHFSLAETLAPRIDEAASRIVESVTSGGKVLCCGNGSASQLGRHFVAQLMGSFERERPGMAALSLSRDPTLFSQNMPNAATDSIFGRQIHILGQPGDVLLIISTSGMSSSTLAAAQAAHEQDMGVIALTGHGQSVNSAERHLAEMMTSGDIHLPVLHERKARILEAQLVVLHALCDAIDLQLLGDPSP
jgi:D-sedoheptulose 7-phosphate isomerase